MKLCFICAEYPPVPHGGVGTFTQVIGRALVAAGHEVRVAGVYRMRHTAPAYEEDQGVRVWRLPEPTHRGGWIAGRYHLYRLVRGWIDAGEVDLVDAPDHEGAFAGWPRLPVPLVLRAGGAFSYFARELGKPLDPMTYRLERWAYRRTDRWIAKSRYTGEVTRDVFGLRDGPHAVLYNPVNAPADAPPFAGRSTNRIVFTGTLTEKKGIVQLVDAWPTVRARQPDAELHVYGKDGVGPQGGSMRAELLRRLPDAARESVRFHDHVSRAVLYEALATARAAVFPSFSEGFAWAPLEAMANGCPTVYTRLGSGPELITDGEDGLLVDPARPAEIATALLRLLQDAELARRLGEAGRARILGAFTLEKLLPANEAFYADVVRSFRPRARADGSVVRPRLAS
jgi:glycosyltransferase involved in cell wall biosynthesis